MTSILLLAVTLWVPFGELRALPSDTTGPVAVALAFAKAEMQFDFAGAAAGLHLPAEISEESREVLARQIPVPRRSRGEVVQCEAWSDVKPPAVPKCTFGVSHYITVSVHELIGDSAVITVAVASPADNLQRITKGFVKLKLIRGESGWRVESVLSRGAS